MTKIAILTDSSADITNKEAKEKHINVIRMPITIDNKHYLENDDITDEEFINKMYDGSTPKTSQPVLGTLIKTWKKLLEENDYVVFVPISKGISGTYNSAVAASKEFDGKVVVVDAKSACYPLQYICEEAVKMADKGLSAEEIKNKLENETNMFATLLPDDLIYLKRGGRISSAAAALAGLLKIVPILKVDEGSIDVLGKVRTFKKAQAFAIDHITDVDNVDDYKWVVIQVDNMEGAKAMKEALEEKVHDDIQIVNFRAVITSHVGPKTLAIGRVKKLKY